MPTYILPEVYKVVGVREGEKLPSYTSIGGYTIIYYTKRAEPYCGKCATKHNNERDPISHVGIYEEGPDLECSECGNIIESSYGDPEAEKDNDNA